MKRHLRFKNEKTDVNSAFFSFLKKFKKRVFRFKLRQYKTTPPPSRARRRTRRPSALTATHVLHTSRRFSSAVRGRNSDARPEYGR